MFHKCILDHLEGLNSTGEYTYHISIDNSSILESDKHIEIEGVLDVTLLRQSITLMLDKLNRSVKVSIPPVTLDMDTDSNRKRFG